MHLPHQRIHNGKRIMYALVAAIRRKRGIEYGSVRLESTLLSVSRTATPSWSAPWTVISRQRICKVARKPSA